MLAPPRRRLRPDVCEDEGMPKSRGRPSVRARSGPAAQPSLAALALRDAGPITAGRDSLDAETWASEVLGSAWEAAGLLERDPEQTLCREVARRAAGHPSPAGLAA